MSEKYKRPPGGLFIGRREEASYREIDDPLEAFNPFSRALPAPLDRKALNKHLTWHPTITEEDRSRDRDYRMRAVLRLKGFIEPVTHQLRLYDRMDGLLRSGYFNWNPIEEERLKQLQGMYPGKKLELIKNYVTLPCEWNNGLSIIGLSGTGKTVGVKNVLRLYPQVVVHTKYEGKLFPCQQLVWIYLRCPPKGSVRDLILQIFDVLARITNNQALRTTYVTDHLTETTLISRLIRIVELTGLGLIVIDEIQNLLPQKIKFQKDRVSGIPFSPYLIKFLLMFSDTMNFPLVLSGTPEALRLLSAQMAVARRASGETSFAVRRFQKNEAWEKFLNKLWNYQFVAKRVELTQQLYDELYVASQGIIGCAVRVFMFAQWEAMYRKTEKITVEIIKYVYSNHMLPLMPWLKFIEEGREAELSSLGGELPDPNLEDFFSAKAASDGKQTARNSKTKKASKPKRSRGEKDLEAQKNYDNLKREGLIPGLSED